MARYVILPCRLSHLAELARTMRREDRAEIEGAGVHVKHFLFALWKESAAYRRTALVDGEVAACWGDAAGTLEPEGAMWLFTAPVIERVPLAFFREARRGIAERLTMRSVLRSDVAVGYERALRFFSMLGFEILPHGSGGPDDTERREIRISRAA